MSVFHTWQYDSWTLLRLIIDRGEELYDHELIR